MHNEESLVPLTRRELRERALRDGEAMGESRGITAETADASASEVAGASAVATPVVHEDKTADAPQIEGAATEEDAVRAPEGAEKQRRSRGLFSWIGSAIMSAVLIVILAVAAAAIVVPAVTGSTALTVLTSSMEPSLPPGTMVVVRPTADAEITPGKVMTYQLKSGEPTLITHRVQQQLKLADGTYVWITKGDNNPSADPDAVQPVQVRGTVWYAIPYVGWVSAWLSGGAKAWILPIAVGLLFGYAVFMVIGNIRDKARKRREAEN